MASADPRVERARGFVAELRERDKNRAMFTEDKSAPFWVGVLLGTVDNLLAVLDEIPDQLAAHRCGYQLCSECSCRAELVKIARGETDG